MIRRIVSGGQTGGGGSSLSTTGIRSTSPARGSPRHPGVHAQATAYLREVLGGGID
jgi:hypothetical protein